MGKRRHPGEVVWKPPGAGYYKNAGFGRIAPTKASTRCTLCEDSKCRQWPVLLQLSDCHGTLKPATWCYISECEMRDPGEAELLSGPELPLPTNAQAA